MRIFTYSDDLGTAPSVILSTVILEKLLDIFVLVLLFVSTVGRIATPRLRLIATISLAVSAIGLLILLVAARSLQAPVQRLFARLPAGPLLKKIEHWITLALDATGRLGVAGSLLLLFQSVVIWTCEGMIFLSAIRLLGLSVDGIAAWARRLLRQPLLPHPQLPRSHRPLRASRQNLSSQPRCVDVAIRGLRSGDPCLDAPFGHRSRRHHLPHPSHPHPQPQASARRD
ncbi:hypothetical protein RBB78_17855 [Tunturiibacter empetritectus]|uniref:hypothetical protein n=1 Tax=Tunturiibacter empetritectus TaxID=3069691 RepID=UPI003D9BF2D6